MNHILRLIMCMCVISHVQLCDTMGCSLPGFSVHEIYQARILKWVAISFSRGSCQSRDQTHISCIICIFMWILYHWGTWEAQVNRLIYCMVIRTFYAFLHLYTYLQQVLINCIVLSGKNISTVFSLIKIII